MAGLARIRGIRAMKMVAALVAALILGATGVDASDWSRFRGPNGTGISPDAKNLPSTWSETENLRWKIALPGPGSSCPIVVGDRVFVTCWSGYGVGRDQDDMQKLRRHLVCVARDTGKILWDKSVAAELPEDRYGGMFAEHGYASHTPVSDGKRIFAFFGKTGVLAYDLDGKQLWHTKVGSGLDQRRWGSASSPLLYENLVIVPATVESESLVALDQETGKEVWRAKAEGFTSTWGTPILVPVDKDRVDLVIGVPYEIWGFNPKTGKLRWHCDAMDSDSYCSSVVAADGVVYGLEGRGGGSVAVRAGGSNDVSNSHVVWRGQDQNRIGTPVIHDGLIYYFSSKVARCVDAKTGKSLYRERLPAGKGTAANAAAVPPKPTTDNAPAKPGAPGRFGGRGGFGGPGGPSGGRRGGGFGGQDYGSPVAGDGKLFFITRGGDGYVLQLGKEFKVLGVNRLTNDNEDFSASPAIGDGALFIRSSKHLYCVSHAK